jgi:hypothetical protein
MVFALDTLDISKILIANANNVSPPQMLLGQGIGREPAFV